MRRAALLLCGLLGGCTSGTAPPSAPLSRGHDFLKLAPGSPGLEFLKIETVKESDAASAVVLSGRVTFDEDHTQRVASPIDGRVASLLVRLGDRVRSGQGLVQLTSPHVGQLQAEAQKAQEDFGVAQKAQDRTDRLREDGAIPDKEVAQADAEAHKARAESARTTAQLRALGITASDPAVTISLRAQIAGTVVERPVLAGQEVRADQATPLLTISALDTVWVLADLYEQDLGLVKQGAHVAVHVPAYPGESFPGEVGHVAEVVDAQSRTVKIRCVVANTAGKLKPEMFARVDLKDAGGRGVITIPSRGVLLEGEHAQVVVASEGGVFRTRRIEVGPELEGRVRVIVGLAAGEKVVTEGAIFLKRELEAQ